MKNAPLIITLFCLLILASSFTQKNLKIDVSELPQNEAMKELGVRVYIHTSYNLYKGTPFPSNGLIISTKEGIALIDGAWGVENTSQLINYCKDSLKQDIKFVIGTHFHDDRIGGVKLFNELNIPVYVNSKTAELAAKDSLGDLFILNHDTSFGGITISPNYLGAGHTLDNQVVYLPIANILFGGCLVKSLDAGGMGNIADADLKQWPATIKAVKKKYNDAEIIVPGHGDYGNTELLNHTLKLLKQSK